MIYRGAQVDKGQSTTQSSRFLDDHCSKGRRINVYLTVTIRIASHAALRKSGTAVLVFPPHECMISVPLGLAMIMQGLLSKGLSAHEMLLSEFFKSAVYSSLVMLAITLLHLHYACEIQADMIISTRVQSALLFSKPLSLVASSFTIKTACLSH